MVEGYALDRKRKSRARLLAGVFSAGAAALLVLLMIGNVRQADAEIKAHFENTSRDATFQAKVLGPRGWALLVAALCVLLGFATVALVAMYRIR